MTVEELANALWKLPPHLQVLIPGYEYGWDECPSPAMTYVSLAKDDLSYAGRYRRVDTTESDVSMPAVILGGERI